MMQDEYEAMVGHDVSPDLYDWIEQVYLHHPAFNCPDDVRQFVRRRGGEERMAELVALAQGVYHDRENVIAKARRDAQEAQEAHAEACEARRHKENDERTIVELTRQAREAESLAQAAVERAEAAERELRILRERLGAVKTMLAEEVSA